MTNLNEVKEQPEPTKFRLWKKWEELGNAGRIWRLLWVGLPMISLVLAIPTLFIEMDNDPVAYEKKVETRQQVESEVPFYISAPRQLERRLKPNLRDPDSYQHIQNSIDD